MAKPLIVFDWNGTLLADTRASWRAGNECLKFYGAEPISLARYRETFHFPILHFYHLNGVSADTVLARREEGNAVFQEAYEAMAATARTRTGARELLDWLQTKGFASIILSNYQTERIAEQCRRLRLLDYFETIDAHSCNGTTILQSTTKAERLGAYMECYDYCPEDTVIIGDSHEEPEIARLLGLTCIGITDGYISRKRLREAGPDYIVNRLDEIQQILGKS